jgi:5-methylcytosine-specific restriction endonuclease McrA
MDTLVLNDSFMPINRVSWKRAITWVVTGRAQIVEEYEGRVIRSPSQVFPMPSVVRFLHRVVGLFRKGVKFNRKNVWLRDKGRCQYCGTKVSQSEFTFDHVMPRDRGGTTKWGNIVVSCMNCNQKKGNRTPEQAKMRLRIRPIRPRSLPGVSFPILVWDEQMPQTWRDYLGSFQYWNSRLESD